jgi:sigma-B regulation protein RsbU (phosphoserine phosphatase)
MSALDGIDISDLLTLNEIGETLNQAVDVSSVLEYALQRLLELTDLQAGWIFLIDEKDTSLWAGRGYRLAAHHGLPRGMAPDSEEAWRRGCDCQGLLSERKMRGAYNEVRCSRLTEVAGEVDGLAVHASVPLRTGYRTLGILNVAAPEWTSFSPRALALLTNAGNQMGVAVERAQLFDLLREQRVTEQQALLEFTNQLLSNRRLGDLLNFLVDEVRRMLQIDACAVLLPDPATAEYLRFAAASGWRQDPVAHQRRVPAGPESGSGRVMRSQEPIVDEDLSNSTRFPWMYEWLTGEEFQAAAIVPLICAGHSIGTLVVDTRQSRRMTGEELHFLQLMANQAALAIETARLHEEELQRQRLENELEVGRRIQLSMLPPTTPRIPGWDVAAYYQAARQVGGDFYDFYRLAGEGEDGRAHLGLVIADVADKGVPAALFMALSRTTLRGVTHSLSEPAAALEMVNRLIYEEQQSDLFLTAFYGVLDPATGRLTFANGGHNPPLLIGEDGQFRLLSVPGMALSVLSDIKLGQHQEILEPGDVLILYTDGVTEASDDEGREFEVEGILTAVGDHDGATSSEIVGRIVAAVTEHSAGRQSDDFTLVVVKRLSLPDQPDEFTTDG